MDKTVGKIVAAYILFSVEAWALIVGRPGLGQLALASAAVVYSILLSAKAVKEILALYRPLTYAGIQALTAAAAAAVLYYFAVIIRDGSPLPLIALGIVVFLCINLLLLSVYGLAGQNAGKVVTGLLIFLVCVSFIRLLPVSIDTTRTFMLRANEEVQYIFRYKDDIYYNSNRYDGVYRLSPGGEIEKILDTPRIKKRTDINLWLEDNLLYFIKDGKWYSLNKDGKWHSLNLDTGQVKEQPDFQVKHVRYSDYRNDFLEDYVSEKLGFIYYCKVFSDGYIYFSTDNGLYRTRQGSGEPELLVNGDITMFDIKGDRIKYYDVNRTPRVNEAHLP